MSDTIFHTRRSLGAAMVKPVLSIVVFDTEPHTERVPLSIDTVGFASMWEAIVTLQELNAALTVRVNDLERREMKRNVIEVEREQCRDPYTTPPTRLGRREAAVVLFAHRHRNRGQSSRPPAVSSITHFAPASAGLFRSIHS